MSPLFARILSAQVLLLTAACDRNIYLGYDEVRDPAGAQALVVPHEDLAVGAGLVQEPADAGSSTRPVDAGFSTQPVDAGVPAPEDDAGPAATSPPAVVAPLAPKCLAPQADCDGRADNGCETNFAVDRLHCGACDRSCGTQDCACEDGTLVLHCPSGHADCDGDVTNGCETDLQNSAQHCGTCQHACHTQGLDVASAACVAGQCELTCQGNVLSEADCDHDPDNGCETYLLFDRNNCGQCGRRCITNCEAGFCML